MTYLILKLVVKVVRANQMHNNCPNERPREILAFLVSEIWIANNDGELYHMIIHKMRGINTSWVFLP